MTYRSALAIAIEESREQESAGAVEQRIFG
jgi:hypothetical protein